MTRQVPAPSSRSAEIRQSLDHPIIDSDGHHVEYQPAVFDVLARVGGTVMVDRYAALRALGAAI